ncbi:MAG: extracellular solute-binding protein [Caldilineaceae bacterium]|nr:extracellular solute-binding protein [Caldilineaceae bacterium]
MITTNSSQSQATKFDILGRPQIEPPRTWLWRLASLLLCTLLTSGCGDLRERALAYWPFGSTATPTPTTTPVSLLGWTGSTAENSQLQEAILAFEQAHPSSPVAGRLVPNYNATLENELGSANPPDLFLAYSHQLADLVADGHLLPIPANYPVAATVWPNLVAGLQVDGQNYCFPRDVAVLRLYYNPAVFDRAEAAYPQDNWSWTEFRAALDATADINNGYRGLVLEYDLSRFYPFLLQSSSDDDLWQGPDALAALEYFMDLYNDEVATTPGTLDSSWNGEAFGRGRAAMTIEGNWLDGYLASEFPGLNYGVVDLPAGPAGRGTTAFISCWVVHATTDNPTEALEMAAFLTSPAQISAWTNASGNLPPSQEQASREQTATRNVASALASAAPWTGPAGFVNRAETVNIAMRMWYNDQMTTPELLASLATMSQHPPLPQPTTTPSD